MRLLKQVLSSVVGTGIRHLMGLQNIYPTYTVTYTVQSNILLKFTFTFHM